MGNRVGRQQKSGVQIIGDRMVTNPRTRLCHLRDAEGNVFETFRLSLEVCGCGYSLARPGVGYAGLLAGTASGAGSSTRLTQARPGAPLTTRRT